MLFRQNFQKVIRMLALANSLISGLKIKHLIKYLYDDEERVIIIANKEELQSATKQYTMKHRP